MATLAFTKDDGAGQIPSAPLRVNRLKLVADTDYPAGGYPAGLADRAGFKDLGSNTKPLAVLFEGCNNVAYTAMYNRATDKIVLQTAGAEVAAGANAVDGMIFYFGVIYP